MAVDFGKLNKAGLGASSFGTRKTTGTSAQVAKNLSSSTAATRSSVFSFRGSTKTNWTPGQHVSKNMHKYDYQGVRGSMNGARGAGRTYAPSFSGPVGNNFGKVGSIKVNNDYAKGMIIGQTIMGGISLLNQLGAFDGIGGSGSSSSSLGDKLGNLFGGGGSTPNLGDISNGSVASSISGMSSASDSASLRSAISAAETQLTSLNSQTASLTSAADTAKGQIDTLETNVDKGKDTVKQSTQNLSNAKNTVTSRTNMRDNKLNALEQADSAYGKATADYTKAHDAHENAKIGYSDAQNATSQARSALASAESMPDTNPDGSVNTAKQQAVKEAKAKLAEAEKNEAAAKTKMDQAKTAEDKARTAKDTAYNNLGSSKAAVDKAEGELTAAQNQMDNAKTDEQKAKDNLTKAQDGLKEAQDKLEDANGAIEKLKAHTKDVEKLQDAINDQKERLTDLENDELKAYNKSKNKAQKGIAKNNERSGEIHGEADTWRERRLSNKIGKTNEKVDEHQEKMAGLSGNLDQTYIANELSKTAPTATIGGQQYRTGVNPATGNTVYARDGQMISEEEYNKAVQGAGL